MNQAIAKQDRPVDLLKATINAPSVQEQFKNALGEHKDTFVASLDDKLIIKHNGNPAQPKSLFD